MNEPVRVGVVGVGALGRHHARIYAGLDTAELVGVYDVDQARAAAIASEHKTRVFDSVDALANAVEAASVAVPAEKHFDVAKALMNRGVHLLVEKPIAANAADAEAMVKMAEDTKLLLQVGHVERFNPVMAYLEEMLVEPRFIEAVRLTPYPVDGPTGKPRGTDVSVVLDLMIHDLEIILHLVKSKVREIHAIGVPVLSSTEDIVNVRLCFENGCVANVSASRISREPVRKIRVFEENSYLSLDYSAQSGELHRKTGSGISSEAVPIEKGDALTNELATFVLCVTEKDQPAHIAARSAAGRPVVSGRHASAALRLAVEICEKVREGGS